MTYQIVDCQMVQNYLHVRLYYVKSPQSFCAACERIYCSERPAKAAKMFVHI